MRWDADDLVKRVKDIPTLPSVVMQVNSALQDDSASLESVISIIEKDPPMTSKVLRLANSSYYGMSRHVRTVKEAVLILGLNTIRSIAMAVAIGKLFRRDLENVLNMKELWVHSLHCAVATKALTKHRGTVVAEEGFICGLVHDIGKLILAMNLPDQIKTVAEKCAEGGSRTWLEGEREVLGFTHAEIGSLIARRWHFPKTYCEGIEYHHQPDSAGMLEAARNGQPTNLLPLSIFVGNSLARSEETNSTEAGNLPEPATLQILGIEENAYPSLLEKIREDFENVMNTWELE